MISRIAIRFTIITTACSRVDMLLLLLNNRGIIGDDIFPRRCGGSHDITRRFLVESVGDVNVG